MSHFCNHPAARLLDRIALDDEAKEEIKLLGEEVLSAPADASDRRVLPPWQAALAVVGIRCDLPPNWRDARNDPARWLQNHGQCKANVDSMNPKVADRIREALELVEFYSAIESRAGRDPKANVPIIEFMRAAQVSAPPDITEQAQAAAPAINALPAPGTSRQTVKQALAPYISTVMANHLDFTAKELYAHMRREAGKVGVPFSMPRDRGNLHFDELGKSFGWSTVSAALTAYNKQRKSCALR